MRVLCIVLVSVLASVGGVKPKSINLALETVIRFEKENQAADLKVINRVQNFLDTIKKVITDKNGDDGSRKSNTKSLKLTDFIRESAKILKTYDDDDLKDVFVVLDNELKKHHTSGKFYELFQNHAVRRFMSNQLEQIKSTSASTLRKYLDKVVTTLDKDDFTGRDRFIVNLLNSLYSDFNDVFSNTIHNLRRYRKSGTGVILTDFITAILKQLLFDHYSNLDNNAKSQVKTVITHYWISANDNDHKSNDDGKKNTSKLKMIDLNSYYLQHEKPTSAPLTSKKYQVYKIFSKQKLKGGQKRFKVTGETEKTSSRIISETSERDYINTDDINVKIHKKRNKKSKKEGKRHKNEQNVKIITTPKTVSFEYETFLNNKELEKLTKQSDHLKIHSDKKHKKLKEDLPKGIQNSASIGSFEITIRNIKPVKKYDDEVKLDKDSSESITGTAISKSNENENSERVKNEASLLPEDGVTNYYDHALKSDEVFASDNSQNGEDEEKYGLPIENNLSFENVEVDQNSFQLLTGGLETEDMNYSAKSFEKNYRKSLNEKTKKVRKSKDSEESEELLTEHSPLNNVHLPDRNRNVFQPATHSTKKHQLLKEDEIRQHRRLHKKEKRARKGVKIDTIEVMNPRKSPNVIKKPKSHEGMTIESIKTVQKPIDALKINKQVPVEDKHAVKSNASFRATSVSAEETINATKTTNLSTAKTTTQIVKSTTELKATIPSTTMANLVKIESSEALTTSVITTSNTTTINITKAVENTNITSLIAGHTITRTVNSIAPNVKTTEIITTAKLLSSMEDKKNKSLRKNIQNLLMKIKTENATKSTEENTKENTELQDLREKMLMAPNSDLNELEPKSITDMTFRDIQSTPVNSMEKSNIIKNKSSSNTSLDAGMNTDLGLKGDSVVTFPQSVTPDPFRDLDDPFKDMDDDVKM